MKKAILCIGNPMRGDDDVGNEVGRIVEQESKRVGRSFLGKMCLRMNFQLLEIFAPDILIVVDAMSGFDEDKIEFFDLSDDRDYIYSTHNLPNSSAFELFA